MQFLMRSIPKPALALAVLVVALAVVSVYLFLELGQRSDALDSTRTTLAASQSSNVALQTEKTTLEAALSDANAQNAALSSDKAILEGNIAEALDAVDEWTAAYDESQGALQASRTAYGELETEHTTLEQEHQQLGGQLAILERDHRQIRSELVTTEREFQTLSSEHQLLGGQYATLDQAHRLLEGQYADLQTRAGTLLDLESQVAALKAEISELEAKRRPLILSVDRRGFYCTGSMEPKITCLDEATWLENPKPEEIVVGTIISFDAVACDEDATWTIAHRVTDIKVLRGNTYYLPKGDANRGPDCWVPFSRVNGYIVEIHKDVRPENAELRRQVNAALAAYDNARDAYDEAEETYDEARDAFYALRDRHCPGRPTICTLPSPAYERAVALRAAWDAATDALNDAGKALDVAREYYACWRQNAEDSQYPGHIPYACS